MRPYTVRDNDRDSGGDAPEWYECPTCSYGTSSYRKFIEHGATHEEKRIDMTPFKGSGKLWLIAPQPYNFEPGTLFAHKILIWFEGDWWLTDNPEQEFGRPSHYIELPELPVPTDGEEE